MRSWLRSRRVTLVLAVLLWAAGCLVIWRALPVVPHHWQPPADQEPLGFLSDGRTLVTVPYPYPCGDHYSSGPIRLWDVDTGRLWTSHLGPEQIFDRVLLDHGHD